MTLRIGTRGSALALAQATMVRDALATAGVPTELSIITTEGDTRAPDTAWGEGAFVGAIEAKLLGGDVDVAVHSAKDVPTDEDPRLVIGAYLPRAPQGDVVVARAGTRAASLDDLPSGARVGTDSPRRTAFLRALRPDLRMHPLHGNVDTRLRKLDDGQSDALVLAEAGLTRLGRADRISFRLSLDAVPPAPGQGAVAVQVRTGDRVARAAVARLDHAPTRAAVELERSVLAASGGGCRAPIGVAAALAADGVTLDVVAGFARPDGTLAVIERAAGPVSTPTALAGRILGQLADAAARAALDQPWPRAIVTRASEQSAALVLALVDREIAPLAVPAIAIEPATDGLAAAAHRLGEYAWVAVTSANAARAADRAVADAGSDPEATRWAAVGVATSRALAGAGIPVAFRPARASGRDLGASLPVEPGDRVLVPRSDIADDALVDALTARGAAVDAVVAYRTVEAPAGSRTALTAALAAAPSAAILTSGSTARGLLALGEATGASAAVRALPVVCIGEETAAEARRLGFVVAATAGSREVAAIGDATAGVLHPHDEMP